MDGTEIWQSLGTPVSRTFGIRSELIEMETGQQRGLGEMVPAREGEQATCSGSAST
jgi:hypothetical protein